MLCRRCEDLFCGLKAAKKGSRKEILYHHDTRRFSTGSCQDCNVCKFFRSNNYYQGQISKITLAKETSTNYILVADVQDPKNPGKERNGMLYQVTQVDLHHGIDTTHQHCLSFLTLLQTDPALVSMNRPHLRGLLLALLLPATGFRAVRETMKSADNVSQQRVKVGTQQDW
jgi:hypothetical protein